MEQDPTDKKVVKIKVTDKRRGSDAPSDADDIDLRSDSPRGSAEEQADALRNSPVDASASAVAAQDDAQNDFLDDLKRLQADFDNYRKRMLRESAESSDRATARVLEDLLPVLDNFERAIAHGEGGEGVQLVFKDFSAALERLGLEEVPAEGAAFDPNLHEAVESRETEGLEEPTIIEVYRRGYMHKDRLIRPAMVVVGRPVDREEGE